jgi:DNA-binding NarL/FixJ family response regulator
VTVSSNFTVIQQAVRLLAPELALIDAGVGMWAVNSLIDRLANISAELRILAFVPDEQIEEPGESGRSKGGSLTLLPVSASEDLLHETLLRIIGADPRGPAIPPASPSPPEGGPLGILTPRQRDILRLICCAESTKGIARMLDISTRTVEFHKYRMMKALAVNTMAELILFGITSGLGSRPPRPLPLGEADVSMGRGPYDAARKTGSAHYRLQAR